MDARRNSSTTNRRKFLGALTSVAASLGLSSVPSPVGAKVSGFIQDPSNLDAWFNTLTGKHKMVFDAVSTNDGLPIVYTFNFMSTNNQTGTPDDQLSALVVFRSKAILAALNDNAWNKYKLGKMFKVIDYSTNSPSERNLFWEPREGEMPNPGMSMKALQERGVKLCVCETAITLTSRQYAISKSLDPSQVKNEWIASLLPGIQLVPSGVWALGRAQEHGCAYCYAG
ncbi:MAG: twin-arginine translocation signal domain-containing protein [Cyclobacteriaceae bacterium]